MAGYNEEWVDVQKSTFTRVRTTDGSVYGRNGGGGYETNRDLCVCVWIPVGQYVLVTETNDN